MRHVRHLLVPAAVLAALLAASAHAQTNTGFSIELRGGASFPTGQFGADQTIDTNGACCLHNSTGWNLTGSVMYALTPNAGVYLGVRHDDFSVANPAGPTDWDVVDSGVAAGLRLGIPLRVSRGIRPFAEGGVVFSNARSRSRRAEAPAPPTEARAGFEVGGGIALDLSRRFSVTPAVRYRKHNTHAQASGGFPAQDGEITYMSADVGLQFRP